MTVQRVLSVHPGPPPVDDIPLREWLTRFQVGVNAAFSSIATDLDTQLSYSSQTFDIQNPAGLDTPLLIRWGSSGEDDFVRVNASGEITILRPDTFLIDTTLQISRSGQPSTSVLFTYMSLEREGIVTNSRAVATTLETPEAYVPVLFTQYAKLQPGDVLRLFIVRDSAGADDGGLYPYTTASPAVPNAASAALTIRRIGL